MTKQTTLKKKKKTTLASVPLMTFLEYVISIVFVSTNLYLNM